MGPTQINGLPAHILLVHVVVVLVPLTAIALIACAVWPSWMRRMGLVLPLLALVTLVSVPLTTHAGEWLERHTASTPLIRRHTELGDGLLPWAIGLFVLAAGLWWWNRRTAAASTGGGTGGAAAPAMPLRVAAAVVCAVVAAGAVVQVYRIGDSGAKAAWTGNFSKSPASSQHR
ncbi:DUF2231 domain-containing protein [Actinacidiphila sp. bgisy144]|uniref:DUF2231 domain-containing protein n=1 Tax=Actinacidiphila sp. bgisy144 TaxID=3413791 RepID=UPI003EB74A40